MHRSGRAGQELPFEFKVCSIFLLQRTPKKQSDHENGIDSGPKVVPNFVCHSFVKILNKAAALSCRTKAIQQP